MSQFFEILIFSQDIWGNVHYVPEINQPHFLRNSDKNLLSPEQNNLKEIKVSKYSIKSEAVIRGWAIKKSSSEEF